MLATLVTAVVDGLAGSLVRVEVDVAPGIPVTRLVGLPDAALSEARERVRAAIHNAGYDYPASRVTVNLAPADRPKRGAAYDLAIAVGILVASGQVRVGGGSWALLGELSLDGSLQAVSGVLPMVATLVRAGHRRIAVPAANAPEGRLVAGAEVVPVAGLDEAARLVAGPRGRRAAAASLRPAARVSAVDPSPMPTSGGGRGPTPLVAPIAAVDLADVRGQAMARWALEIALAGCHNLLLVGPPGAGKTLLARAIPLLLPPLDDDEALEATVVASVAGLLSGVTGLCRDRPFRAPHHTSSYAALVGGGPRLAPGEVTLAHHGVLFLDELAEFDRNVLDALRQPLEDGSVTIARAGGQVRYPARLQLVAAMNPCRCGFAGDASRPCRCPAQDPERYVRRVSGPLLDRLDLRVEMERVPPEALLELEPPESSSVVRARIAVARAVARERNGGVANALLSGSAALRLGGLDERARRRLEEVAARQVLTARGVHRLVRVARTIADLGGRPDVDEATILAAANLRDPAGRAEALVA